MINKILLSLLILVFFISGCSRHHSSNNKISTDEAINKQLSLLEREENLSVRENKLRQILEKTNSMPGLANQTTIFVKLALGQTLISEGKNIEGIKILNEINETPYDIIPEYHPVRIEVLSRLANYFLNQANLHDAIKTYEKSLKITDKNMGKDSIQSGKICLTLASLEKEVGNLDASKKYISRAYEVSKTHHTFSKSDIADVESELFRDLKDFKKSFTAASIALRDDEKHPERGILPLCRDLNDLGITCETYDKPKLAKNYLLRSLSLLDKVPFPKRTYDHYLYSFEAHLYLFCVFHKERETGVALTHLEGILENLRKMIKIRNRSPQTESVVFGMALHALSDLSHEKGIHFEIPALVEQLKEQIKSRKYEDASITIDRIIKEYDKTRNQNF